MKIPKYIDELITRRQRLADDLVEADIKLCEWLEKQGIDLNGELTECTYGGVLMYSEPYVAAKTVREAIEKA